MSCRWTRVNVRAHGHQGVVHQAPKYWHVAALGRRRIVHPANVLVQKPGEGPGSQPDATIIQPTWPGR